MIVIMLDGRLHLAPIDPDLQSVLDVGTGTGIWAIEFGEDLSLVGLVSTNISTSNEVSISNRDWN